MPVDLADNQLLQGFHPGWVSWFRDYCIEIGFNSGDYLIEGGSVAAGMYILLDGRVSVLNRNGESIAAVESGGVVGEMSLIDGGSRSADVVAETPVSTLMITRDNIKSIGKDSPDIGFMIMSNLCQIITKRARHLHQLIN